MRTALPLLTLLSLVLSACGTGDDGSVQGDTSSDMSSDANVLDVETDGPVPPAAVQLEIESTVERVDPEGNRTTSVVSASITLERQVLAGSQANYQGFGGLQWVEFDLDLNGCEVGAQQLLDGLVEAQLTLDVGTDDVDLYLNPGDPLVSQTLTCDGITDDVPFGYWREGFDLFHVDELSPASAGAGYPYRIAEWDNAGEVLGSRVYMQSETASQVEWTETTSLTVR